VSSFQPASKPSRRTPSTADAPVNLSLSGSQLLVGMTVLRLLRMPRRRPRRRWRSPRGTCRLRRRRLRPAPSGSRRRRSAQLPPPEQSQRAPVVPQRASGQRMARQEAAGAPRSAFHDRHWATTVDSCVVVDLCRSSVNAMVVDCIHRCPCHIRCSATPDQLQYCNADMAVEHF